MIRLIFLVSIEALMSKWVRCYGGLQLGLQIDWPTKTCASKGEETEIRGAGEAGPNDSKKQCFHPQFEKSG